MAPANVRVLVRVRPLNDRETKFSPDRVLDIDDGGMAPSIDFGMAHDAESKPSGGRGTVSIVDTQGGGGGYGSGYESGANGAGLTAPPAKSFTYDAVFGPESRQVQIFDSVKGIVDAVCAGYNGTIVAYGQTGSGKTHTIFGDDDLQDNDNAGLVQRSLKSIFHKISAQSLISPTSASAVAGGTVRTTTKASFLEIYNEKVYDLLHDGSAEDDKGLPVREDALKGVYVDGLVEREVTDTAEAMEVLRHGMANRKVAATNMNRVSSRSHAMFVLTVTSELFSDNGISKVRTAKYTLVDLAGSERQKTTAADGDRLKEASMINNSLLCLGQVINSLVDRETGKQNHVPFRDSKLTFLLRDSWGGNSKTCLVATVTPSLASLSETTSTLKFAQRAKLIKNTAVLNENTCGSVAALQAEIARLRSQLEGGSTGVGPAKSNPGEVELSTNVTVSALRQQNSKLNKKVKLLKDATNHREKQVTSLKRKLQQETLIRQCKERRITYLASKGKSSGTEENSDEVAALQQEVAALREQLDAPPSESVEWMIKFKEEKAKVEQMQLDASTTLEADEKNELQTSLVALLDERDTLQQKVQAMALERNNDIDSIIKDVAKLESANNSLQSQLDEKESEIVVAEEKIQSNETQLGELQTELKTTLDCLESAQTELAAEKEKAIQLQTSVDGMKVEVNGANAAAAKYEGNLKKMTEEHNESTAALHTQISELQKDVDTAMEDNESMIKKLQEASDELNAKQVQLEGLAQEKVEALLQLDQAQEKGGSDVESLKQQEEALRAEIAKGEETIASLMAEKVEATNNLEKITVQNTALSGEVEALKADRETLGKLRDQVASLEDEVVCVTIEKEQVEAKLFFAEADLERTVRLQEQIRAAESTAHDNDLAHCDEIIRNLSQEETKIEEKLAEVSQQLLETSAASDEKVAQLQNEIGELQDRANSLEVDTKAAEDAAESLRGEKAAAAEQLETAQAQSLALSEEVESLKSDRDALQLSLDAKVAELQKSLDDALEDNESLTASLAEAKTDLEAKKAELESLEHDKEEALKQLEQVQEKGGADVELFKQQEEALKAEIAKGEETIESLLAEKAQVTETLKNTTAKYDSLSEEAKVLKAERDTLDGQLSDANSKVEASAEELKKMADEHKEATETMRSKIAELQNNVDAATNVNESLSKELKDAQDTVEAKKADLETLSQEKADALKQLDLAEKDSADIKSYRLREEELKAQIKEGEETIATLTAEKAEADANLGKMSDQNASLSGEVAAMQAERETLKQRVVSLQDDVSNLEDDVQLMEIESEHKEGMFRFAEADLERTVRLHEEASYEQALAHDNDLANRDAIIGTLAEEKASLRQKLVDAESESNEKMDALQDELSRAKETLAAMELKADETQAKLEAAKADCAKSTALMAEQEEEFKAKLDAANKEHKEALEAKEAKVTELEALVEQLKGENETLNEKSATLADSVKEGEAVCGKLKSNEAQMKEELTTLQAKIEALEKENAALRDQPNATANPQPAEWASSPIKPAEEPVQDTTFGADESFDEDAFLPNIDEDEFLPNVEESTQPVDETETPPEQMAEEHKDEDNTTPPVDETKSPQKEEAEERTPSKTPFKERRALFSPLSTKKDNNQRSPHVSKKKASKKKAEAKTPVRRVTRRTTRAMKSATRTPLGKSSTNTPATLETGRKRRSTRKRV